jgi:hypothetical protein
MLLVVFHVQKGQPDIRDFAGRCIRSQRSDGGLMSCTHHHCTGKGRWDAVGRGDCGSANGLEEGGGRRRGGLNAGWLWE